jgi:hypothetical protein
VVETRAEAPNAISAFLPEFAMIPRATNRAQTTVVLYLHRIRLLDGHFAERGMPRAADRIAREHLEAFLDWMLNERGYAAASAKDY